MATVLKHHPVSLVVQRSHSCMRDRAIVVQEFVVDDVKFRASYKRCGVFFAHSPVNKTLIMESDDQSVRG